MTAPEWPLRRRMVGLARWASILVLLAAASGAAAQSQAKVYRVGYLGIVPPTASTSVLWDAFVAGLREHGYVEGGNLVLHRRYSAGQDARFSELAAELVRLNVDVIVSSTTNGALAAKQVTSTIPIVTIVAGDPVGSGLVASLARPGGNVTGLSSQAPDWAAKQLQLLREVAPGIKRVAVLWNPTLPQHRAIFGETQRGAETLRLEIESLEVRSPDDLEGVFQRIAHLPVGGLQVFDQPAVFPQRQRVVDLVTRSRLPAIYGVPAYVEVGGLMSYSPNLADLFRRSTTYVDKLLRGAKAAELPVEQPTTFEFVINLKAAKSLGITLSPALMQRVNRVVE
jgi:putative ABC transport system substrate-binding protein